MNQRTQIIAVVAFALAVIAVFAIFNPRNTHRVQSAFLGVISPMLKQGSALDRRIKAFREGLKTLEQLEEETKRLRVINKELSATNQTLRGLEAENNRLRNALKYRQRADFQLQSARIIGRDASTWYQTIMVDRGTEEGVTPDMPVITEEGLVGKTSVVSEDAATVILISDENCRVSANIEGMRELQGVCQGERTAGASTPMIRMNFLPKDANVTPGLKVYSSGAGGVFPSGVLIGIVKEFKQKELDGYAIIIPAVDLATIEDVFIVVGKNR